MFDEKRIAGILSAAYERRASILLETDGFEILKALGFKTCQSKFVRSAQEARGADWNSFSGNKVVVKVVSPDILHKSDVGGVATVANEREAIASTIEAMAARLHANKLAGFTVNQFVTYDAALGGELLLGTPRKSQNRQPRRTLKKIAEASRPASASGEIEEDALVEKRSSGRHRAGRGS